MKLAKYLLLLILVIFNVKSADDFRTFVFITERIQFKTHTSKLFKSKIEDDIYYLYGFFHQAINEGEFSGKLPDHIDVKTRAFSASSNSQDIYQFLTSINNGRKPITLVAFGGVAQKTLLLAKDYSKELLIDELILFDGQYDGASYDYACSAMFNKVANIYIKGSDDNAKLEAKNNHQKNKLVYNIGLNVADSFKKNNTEKIFHHLDKTSSRSKVINVYPYSIFGQVFIKIAEELNKNYHPMQTIYVHISTLKDSEIRIKGNSIEITYLLEVSNAQGEKLLTIRNRHSGSKYRLYQMGLTWNSRR